MQKQSVLIIGASDLGTACSLRLFHAGLQVIILEKDCPLDIYHSRSFSSTVYSGFKSINNIKAKTYARALEEDILKANSDISDFIKFTTLNREIPVITETDKSFLKKIKLNYIIVCDLVLFENIKNNLPENIKIIGFNTEIDTKNFSYTICNAGSYFGRAFYAFNELSSSETKVHLNKKDIFKQIKAPLEGVFKSSKSIDDLIHEKEEIGKINDIPILSPELGRISGILNSGVIIPAGTVFVEINTSHSGQSGYVLSRDSFCLAGAVLEVILYDFQLLD